MENIKTELKEIITETMIPESTDFIKELETLVENKTVKKDDLDSLSDMKSFIEELETILNAIEKDLISDDEAQEIFDKIEYMIKEHSVKEEE